MFLRERSFSVVSSNSTFTIAQIQNDAFLESFSRACLDTSSMSAMTAGSLAYQISNLALSASFQHLSAPLSWIARGVSPLFALSAEVSVFKFTHHLLQNFHSETSEPFFGKDWLSTFVHFACLKGVGNLYQGSQVLTQHSLQSLAVVGGHQLTASLGWTLNPEGTFAEQCMRAEVENVEMGIAHHIGNRLSGNRLHEAQSQIFALRSMNARNVTKKNEDFSSERIPVFSIVDIDDTIFSSRARNPDWAELNSLARRIGLFSWHILNHEKVAEIAEAYPAMNDSEKDHLVEKIIREQNSSESRENISVFVRNLSDESQVDMVNRISNRRGFLKDELKVTLEFSVFHPDLRDAACVKFAEHVKKMIDKIGDNERLVRHFEVSYLDLLCNLIPRLPERDLVFPERPSREAYVEYLNSLAHETGLRGLRATLHLGKLVLENRWFRDDSLLGSYFYWVLRRGEWGEGSHDEHEKWSDLGTKIFQGLEVERQEEILGTLWESNVLEAYGSFDTLLPHSRFPSVVRTYYRRYIELLESRDEDLRLWILGRIDERVLAYFPVQDRVELLKRIVEGIADHDPDFVGATYDLLKKHLPDMGSFAIPVAERLADTVCRIPSGRINSDDIAFLSRALPKGPPRRLFVRGVSRALERILEENP